MSRPTKRNADGDVYGVSDLAKLPWALLVVFLLAGGQVALYVWFGGMW